MVLPVSFSNASVEGLKGVGIESDTRLIKQDEAGAADARERDG